MSRDDNSPLPFPTQHAAMSTFWRLLRLIRKELSEILRDRRTIITLVLMPLLLYPILSLSFRQFLLTNSSAADKKAEPNLRLGFLSVKEKDQFLDSMYLSRRSARLLGRLLRASGQKKIEFPELKLEGPVEVPPNLVEEVLRKHQVDLVVRLAKNDLPQPSREVQWDLIYLKNSPRSVKYLRQMQQHMAAVNKGLLLTFIPRAVPADVVVPSDKSIAVELPTSEYEFPLATIIPLILILMTITGAVYPAIDLTAGERERGTLEILVAAPVPRLGLLFAKYVSVLTVAMLTALVNIVMMTITIWVNGLGEMLFGPLGLSVLLIVEIFGLLLLFASFFSAVLLTITSFARSFKEAQAYLIPLMLASLAPGLAGMLPGIKLSPALCMVPLLNIVLLGRDLFNHTAAPTYILLVIGSTLVYAAAAIALAARVFGAENVLYNEQPSWADLVRRPTKVRSAPSLPNALVCLCLILFASFLAQGVSSQLFGSQQPTQQQFITQILLFTALSVLLFAGLPLLFAVLRRTRIRTGFFLQSFHPLALTGAILLGMSLWPFVLELLALLRSFGWSMSTEQEQQIADVMSNLRIALPLWLLIVVKVIPAVVEELFFHGYLFSALRKVANAWTAILVAAVLFGAAHIVVTGAFGLERFVPSFLMGIILGWVCWQTGSVVPSMVLHGCHNGMLVLAGYYFTASERSQGATSPTQLPPLWLFAAGAGTILGLIVIYVSRRKPT